MGDADRHRTAKISSLLAVIASAFFAAVGLAGYGRTGDPMQLFLFLALAVLAFGTVKLAFYGINRLLDSIE
jgi:4-hydroxybenzoate polyprenyltransferase